MPAQNRTTLKGYFNTGDRPTEPQFANLIDSGANWIDDMPTEAQAIAGTLDNKFMTPLKVKQAIAANVPSATTSAKGVIEIATTAEAEAGSNTTMAVTPAGAKASALKFAPIKTANGVVPLNGDINTGGGTSVGSIEFGVVKFFTSASSTTNIFHIKTPYNIQSVNGMFYFKAEGHAYQGGEIIDIVWVGYCYVANGALIQTKTNIQRSTAITAGQYVGSDNYVYVWFKAPSTYYCTFRIDSMRVGNGLHVKPGDLTVIVSNQTAL